MEMIREQDISEYIEWMDSLDGFNSSHEELEVFFMHQVWITPVGYTRDEHN